jgi:hypothetical protein
MLQSEGQTRQQREPQRRKGGNPNWRKGVSGNPEGARLVIERRAALVRDIERDLERDVGALTATDRVLIGRAADLLLARPRAHTERVRATNTATRILASIRDRHAAKREPEGGVLTLRPEDGAVGRNDGPPDEPTHGHCEAILNELGRRVQRARIGDIVRIGDVEVEIIADDDDEAAP